MVRGKEGKEATIRWTLEYPPARIYDPVTGRDHSRPDRRLHRHRPAQDGRLGFYLAGRQASRLRRTLCPLVQAADGDLERPGAGREGPRSACPTGISI